LIFFNRRAKHGELFFMASTFNYSIIGMVAWSMLHMIQSCASTQKSTRGLSTIVVDNSTAAHDANQNAKNSNGRSTANNIEDTNDEENSAETDIGAEEDDEELDLISSIDDAEFCKDNIYAQYLKNQYLKDNPKAQNPEKSVKLKSRRRRIATRSPYDQREIEALYFARARLVGETVPYFGAIPVVNNPRVEHWIRFFKNNGRKSFLKWLVRGESVRELVLPILKDQGLPPEFIFLSMVESGFSNQAYSHAKATGPWQFMPGTARLYGLEMNMWIDERRDPAKSTMAAARHLRDLYEEFGDWYLAMAAYNAGPGRVRSAIRMTGTNDFWKLADSAYLPVETKNYVPKVLAALQLSANPAGHGFEVTADPLDVMPVTTVVVKNPADIREIAAKLGTPEKLIRHWNPELINAIVPPKNGNSAGYPLRLSAELTNKWAEVEPQLSTIEVKDVLVHRVRPGETIYQIATRYRVDPKRILSINPGLRASRIRTGTEVAVPVSMIMQKNRSSKKQARLQSSARG
jgi:membrane-bound lytic murein transglycosylase D